MQLTQYTAGVVLVLLVGFWGRALGAYPENAIYQGNIHRQGSTGMAAAITGQLSGLMNGLISGLPSMLTNAIPALMVLGLGGLLLPLLGVSFFFREGQRRTFSLPTINPAIVEGLADVLDRVAKAVEQGEKKYGTPTKH